MRTTTRMLRQSKQQQVEKRAPQKTKMSAQGLILVIQEVETMLRRDAIQKGFPKQAQVFFVYISV